MNCPARNEARTTFISAHSNRGVARNRFGSNSTFSLGRASTGAVIVCSSCGPGPARVGGPASCLSLTIPPRPAERLDARQAARGPSQPLLPAKVVQHSRRRDGHDDENGGIAV